MKRTIYLKTIIAFLAVFQFTSCEKESYDPPPPCEPSYSDRPSILGMYDRIGYIKKVGGYYVIYDENSLTHYYACNLPARWNTTGEGVFYAGAVKTDISHFNTDPNTGDAIAVIDRGPCEAIEQAGGTGCNCRLLELTEILPEYQSSPIW